MGYTAWSDDTYRSFKTDYSTKSDREIFVNSKIHKDMDPKNLGIREARDSEQHPESLAIMFWLDETGSMGRIPSIIAREKLGMLMRTLIDKGINDGQVLFGGIGDHISDRSPLQVGQFEAGTEELAKWLTEIYLEGMGGGGNHESYLLAWLTGANHTAIDCLEKRNQKGFLFTVGDERSHTSVSYNYLKDILGYSKKKFNELKGEDNNQSLEITDDELLAKAQEKYHVFHIHVQEGNYRDNPTTLGYWRDKLGQNLIILENVNDICDVVANKIIETLNS